VLRVAVRVEREHAETVLAELLELAPSGVEEVEVGDRVIEYAVYGAPGELPALPDLTAAAGGALVEVRTSEIADDWSERWREFHRPLVLEGRLTVRPPWEPRGDTPIDLVIDPGQAFGTGAHPTTRLCLDLIFDQIVRARDRAGLLAGGLADLGCGSGVLAIAAARLGFRPVLALDYDPASIDATRANAALNGVVIEVVRHDLRVDEPPDAATVTANLLGQLLLRWADRLGAVAADRRPERVIAGGLLAGEADPVAAAFAEAGLLESCRRERGEWAALLLERAASGA